jgi:hypothetical protein
VKPFYLSSETVLPIKPFYLSNATCAATSWGIDPAAFAAAVNLGKVFRAPTALDVDKAGAPYVAAIEGAGGLPLFGGTVQVHSSWPIA